MFCKIRFGRYHCIAQKISTSFEKNSADISAAFCISDAMLICKNQFRGVQNPPQNQKMVSSHDAGQVCTKAPAKPGTFIQLSEEVTHCTVLVQNAECPGESYATPPLREALATEKKTVQKTLPLI